jgi:tetratricopeptide (TPR) repeat protein
MSNPSVNAARALLSAGNPAGALSELKNVFANDPNSIDGHLIAAKAYLRQQKFAQAEGAARNVLKQEAENFNALAIIAGVYSMQKKHKKGRPFADDLIRLYPDDAIGFLNRAIFNEQAGRYKDAEADYLAALDRDPGGTTNTRALYADFLLDRGKLDDAGRLTQELTGEDAGSVEVAVLRGNVALREGRTDDAREDALWALSQEPENLHAQHLMASIKMKTSPLMGLWWRYAVWIGKFTFRQRIAIVIGLMLAIRLLRFIAGPLAPVIALVWIIFCITTWIGPWMMRRMVNKELKSVEIKPF